MEKVDKEVSLHINLGYLTYPNWNFESGGYVPMLAHEAHQIAELVIPDYEVIKIWNPHDYINHRKADLRKKEVPEEVIAQINWNNIITSKIQEENFAFFLKKVRGEDIPTEVALVEVSEGFNHETDD